jgi:alpha-2-macroglobulin
MSDDTGAGSSARKRRRWGGKDWTIAVLAALVVGLGGTLAWERLAAAGFFSRAPAGEPVSVFDIVLDRDNLAWIDLLFDRPLGTGREGQVLANPPATLSPSVGGVWKWRDAAALRFTPTDQLEMATEYTIALIPERLLGPGQRLVGPGVVTVRTDQFQVEGVTVFEEAQPTEGKGAVILRGEIRFNYPVDPEELATQVRLTDGGAPVEVLLESTYPSESVGFRTTSVVKRPEERTLRLVVEASLTPARGNVPLTGDFVQEIPLGSSERLAVRGVTSTPGERESTVTVEFSSPVSAEAAGRSVTVEPKVDFRAASDRNAVTLTGAFVPGEAYKLTIAQGLAAGDGAVLPEGYAADVHLASLPPAVGFASEGTFLSASGARTLAVETVNVNRVQLTVDRVYRNNLFTLFQYQSYLTGSSTYRGASTPHSLGDRVADETLKIDATSNRRVSTPLGLDRYIPQGQPGFYRVAVSRAEDWQAEQRWVLITDLGMVAKLGEGEMTVWVASFADLSPVAGARVRLLSDQNQALGEGVTDASGLLRLGGLPTGDDAPRPYLLTAERGNDFSFLLLEQSGVDMTGLDVAGAPPRGEGYDAYLYGERDLYRPGESVEGLAVVRDRKLAPPPAMPVMLTHRDPEGQERETLRLTTDARGLAPFSLDLPAYTRTGPHTLELKAGDRVIGSYRFSVEEFVPDRIKVEIEPPAAPPGPGEPLTFGVRGAYLFGPPAAGLAVDARVRLRSVAFAPEGFEQYTFTNPERSFDGLDLLSTSGDLDGEGHGAFKAGIPPGLVPPSSLEAVIIARVQEQGGRGVTAQAAVPVHPFPSYVGLRRTGEGYPEPGREVAFHWVSLDPAGKPAPAGGLRAELYRDRWQTVLRRTPEGTFRYESVRDPALADTRALPAGDPEGDFTFTPKEYGAYRVVLTDLAANSSAEVEFYASGWGYSPWAIKSPGRVELALDRESYKPGETATVQVRSPFPGKLLLTVEREGVLAVEVHRLEGNTATLTLPVKGDYRPNVYVTATVVRAAKDLEPGSPGRAFGAVPLAVDRSDRRLPLEISAPEEMRPESPLEVRVKTAPGAAVTVAAVDEGILRLIDQATPDPFAHFYRKLALGVRSFDVFALLLPEVKGAAAGGGEGAELLSQFVSTEAMRRVVPAAYWSGVLTAGPGGEAVARFDVGELQGTLRVMAVAMDGPRFASDAAPVRVRDRVVVLPTLPRFLQLGDRLQVPVTVRNDTGADGEFEVGMKMELAGAEPVTAAARTQVANGGEATVYLPLAVGERPGLAHLTVTARSLAAGGESTRSRADLPVRAYLPPRRRVAAGSFAEATATFEAPAADFRPDTLEREIAIGPVPLVRLRGRLVDLLAYPYGCLEQVVSKSFPLLYLADLARQLEPKLFEKADPDVLVEEGIRRVVALQLPTGGFGLWPESPAAQPWATVYALHFLVEAKDAGHEVEPYVLDRGLDYAAGLVRAKATYSRGELDRMAYALYVLARAGRPDQGTMDFLRERQRAAMSGESRALLAAAYAATGNPQAAGDLAAQIADAETVERQTGENFASTLRNRALLLLALEDAVPGDARIVALVDRLAREAAADGGWTTQESAFAFVALGRFFHQQAERPPYAGSVLVGGQPFGRFTNEPVTFTGIAGTAPLAVHLDKGYEAGSAYYSLTSRGVPTDASFHPESAGLEVERTFLTRDGHAADLAALHQGDLVVMKTRVRSVSGPVANIVVINLLPPGLEVENPRLRSSETLAWITDATLQPEKLDLRDDRVLAFADLPANSWQTLYTLLRAVVPGTYRLPPVQAEAMYDPALAAVGPLGEVTVGEGR